MRDPVPMQRLEVLRMQPCLVAEFDPLVPAFGKCTEELVQCGPEITAMLEVCFLECGELENERPDFRAMRLQRIQELPLEQFGIEEM